MLFTPAPDGTYRSNDGYRLRWRGYRDNDRKQLFACTCEGYLWTGKCEHSAELSELYEFAARYWPDAASTFHADLTYYTAEYCKMKARKEAATELGNENALTTANSQGA